MTDDRKKKLASMCRLEIRRSVTLALMAMADYGYHFVETAYDAEVQAMVDRLDDAPFDEHDIPALMELLMDELWPRLKASYREHRETHFGKLISGNRDIIVGDAEFAFDVGWIPLVRDAVARMRTYPESWRARIDGGKEKFGCLVLYAGFDGSQRGCRSEIDRLFEEIRLRSLSTCDICGQQGRLRLSSSIAKTVCDKHAAVLGEMRDDDGMWADPWHWRAVQPIEEHINEIVAKGRAVIAGTTGENPWTNAVNVSLLAGMGPPLDRDTKIVTDPLRTTALGRRIDDDT